MMYIEDLAVISESFLNDKRYYEILEETTDLGIRIGEFYKGIDDLSDEKLSKLLSYVPVNEIDMEDKQAKKIIQNIMLSNIKEFKNTLKEIAMFSHTHHPLFKRFKHGGMPIISDAHLADSNTFLSKFDSFNIVCFGKNPFQDVVIIPNSKEIMEKYKKLIAKLQDILKEMINGRIFCFQRRIAGRIAEDIYKHSILSKEESDIVNVALNKFYSSHPPSAFNPEIKIDKNIKADDLGWYSQL